MTNSMTFCGDICHCRLSLTYDTAHAFCFVRANVLLYKERLILEVRFSLKLKSENKHLNGIYKQIADMIGMENTKILFKEYRGQQVIFPVEFYSKQYIYSQIVEEYNGENAKQLATKYGYSERTVRRILKEIIQK